MADGGEEEEESNCSICLEQLEPPGNGSRPTVPLSCGHRFHLDCIGNSFNAAANGETRCPLCRCPLPPRP